MTPATKNPKKPISWRRFLRASALTFAVALLVFGPLADADHGSGKVTEGPWTGSQFDDPGLQTGHISLDGSRPTIAIAGVFVHSGNYLITDIDAPEGKPITGSRLSEERCGPDNFALFRGDEGSTRRFEIRRSDSSPEAEVSFPCNGTYEVTVTGHACQLDLINNCTNRRHEATLSATIGVAVPPQPVTDVAASRRKSESTTTTEPGVPIPTEDDESGSSTTKPDSEPETATIDVSWTYPENPEPDATYVVQRADPGSKTFNNINEGSKATEKPTEPGTAHTQTEPNTVTTNGTYKYRVAALRPNVDPVPSDPVSVKVTGLPVDAPPPDEEDEDDEDEDVSPPATSSSSITVPSLDSSGRLPRSSSSSKVTIPSLSPPTTEDTGFNETLDYGDLEEPGELAAEGQSIINSDVDGLDLMPSIAGAMVLVGWAAHVLYLTRLARQF